MFQETASVGFLDDGEGIINISFPQSRRDGDVLMAWTSRSSIVKLATMGLIDEPIATPSVCLSHENHQRSFI